MLISTSPTFKQKVTFAELNEAGTELKLHFFAIFKRPTLEELEQISKDVTTIDDATGKVKLSDQELMKQRMVGWTAVGRLEEGKEVPVEFSTEAMLEFFNEHTTSQQAAVNAFFDGTRGAKAKNS